VVLAGAPAAVVLAGAPAAVVLAGAPAAVVLAGAEPNVGARAAPGMICAIAKCCCNGKMLGQIANSSNAPILETMPKEARYVIPQCRDCQIYKELSLIGNPLSKIFENGELCNNTPNSLTVDFLLPERLKMSITIRKKII